MTSGLQRTQPVFMTGHHCGLHLSMLLSLFSQSIRYCDGKSCTATCLQQLGSTMSILVLVKFVYTVSRYLSPLVTFFGVVQMSPVSGQYHIPCCPLSCQVFLPPPIPFPYSMPLLIDLTGIYPCGCFCSCSHLLGHLENTLFFCL